MVVVILKCMAENLQVSRKKILSCQGSSCLDFITSVLVFHWYVASCRSQPGSSSAYSVRLYLCVGI